MKTAKPKTYTITEAAKKKGVTRAAIHAAIKAGRLPAKWGNQIVKVLQIPADALDAFQVDHQQKTRGRKRNS